MAKHVTPRGYAQCWKLNTTENWQLGSNRATFLTSTITLYQVLLLAYMIPCTYLLNALVIQRIMKQA